MFAGVDILWVAITVAIILACGVVVAVLLRRYSHDMRITSGEFLLVAGLLVAVVVPVTGVIGTKAAQANATGGYEEFWGGSIVAAESQTTECYQDGFCVHTYDCDPYEELETYWTTETYTDSQGKLQTRSVQKTRWVTKYHSCPYATEEHSYWLVDSFGDTHTIASNIFAENPQAWEEWRGAGLPDIAQGVPEEWQEAKDSIEAGDLPPATKVNKYTNYLLASQDSILAQYSDSIENYREEGLLPYHTADLTDDPIYDGYKADKAVFAGMDQPENYDTWQQSLGRLNSYLGSELQGDLHVVVVPANQIDNPDDYANALLAYWQSRELGKQGLAKNAIMLIIGASADGQTVEWSRADTGIPEGNGELITALSKLDGEPLVPETLLGWPKAQYEDEEITFTASDGVVEQLILRDYPYQRPCMECEDADDSGSGYVYLKANAFISTGAKIWISIVIPVIAGGIGFGLAAWFNFFRSRKIENSNFGDWKRDRRSRYSSFK